MKTICSQGYKISDPDDKALKHYLTDTIQKWSQDALKGMINKAIKSILQKYLDLYRSKNPQGVSSDLAVLIPGIIAMEEFKPFNYQTPAMPQVQRKEIADSEIWQGGFQIEDHEDQALRAFYSDPESMMYYFINNKVDRRKKATCKEAEEKFIKNPAHPIIPSAEDDLINAFIPSE